MQAGGPAAPNALLSVVRAFPPCMCPWAAPHGGSPSRSFPLLLHFVHQSLQPSPAGPIPDTRQDVSRAKVQASIAAGLVAVNGRPVSKAGQQLRAGDTVTASLLPPPPMQVGVGLCSDTCGGRAAAVPRCMVIMSARAGKTPRDLGL